MKVSFKIVTILLLLIGAIPLSGTTPCQKELQVAVHRESGRSIMAAKRSGTSCHGISIRSGWSCCKTAPSVPVPISAAFESRGLQERLLGSTTAADLSIRMGYQLKKDRFPGDRKFYDRTQSILCTFLI